MELHLGYHLLDHQHHYFFSGLNEDEHDLLFDLLPIRDYFKKILWYLKTVTTL